MPTSSNIPNAEPPSNSMFCKQAWAGLASMILAVALSIWIIFQFFGGPRSFQDFDLGKDTESVYAAKNGLSIHINAMNERTEQDVNQRLDASKKPLLLIFGNSQTSGINDRQPIDQNYVGLCYDRFNDSAFVFGHTFPNANMQEQYTAFRYWTQKTRVKYLLLPVFYDDLRENSFRKEYFEYLAGQVDFGDDQSPLVQKITGDLHAMRTTSFEDTAPDARYVTMQERTEAKLNDWLDRNTTIWKNRSNVRGDFLILLYQVRNTLLGIGPQTRRKMIPAIENNNRMALEAILKLAQSTETKVLMYIPPLRQDVTPPYDMTAYHKFKSDILELPSKYPNIKAIDIDNIVPGEFWGMKASTNISSKPEYDFMHFKAQGHELLFEALTPHIEDLIKN